MLWRGRRGAAPACARWWGSSTGDERVVESHHRCSAPQRKSPARKETERESARFVVHTSAAPQLLELDNFPCLPQRGTRSRTSPDARNSTTQRLCQGVRVSTLCMLSLCAHNIFHIIFCESTHLAPAPRCRCAENQRPCPGELSKLARSRLAIAEMSSPSRRSSCVHAQPAAPVLGIRAGAGLVSP